MAVWPFGHGDLPCWLTSAFYYWRIVIERPQDFYLALHAQSDGWEIGDENFVWNERDWHFGDFEKCPSLSVENGEIGLSPLELAS